MTRNAAEINRLASLRSDQEYRDYFDTSIDHSYTDGVRRVKVFYSDISGTVEIYWTCRGMVHRTNGTTMHINLTAQGPSYWIYGFESPSI